MAINSSHCGENQQKTMKRVGNLMPQIAAIDNLYLAYYKARRGKLSQQAVLAFEADLDDNLALLQTELSEGKVAIGDYHYFKIYDPKERLICASSFRERVLQHALMTVCHPYFERYQLYDSYACRKGKGTYAAIERAQVFSSKYTYFAKLDVRKYFETIDHTVLKQQLNHLFKDATLLQILCTIIDAYSNQPNKGLPIGNLTSQYFANHFLAKADHFIKNELRVLAYVRYMDDMVLWGNDLPLLRQQVKAVEQYIEHELHCTLRPTVINRIARGLPFLGYVVWANKLSLAQRSRRRFRRKVNTLKNALEQGYINEQTYQARLLPTLAFAKKANSFEYRTRVFAPAIASLK